MSAILSYLIEHVYRWVIKLTILLIVLNLFQLFTAQWLTGLRIVGMWWLNQTFYTVMTYQSAQLLQQYLVIGVTFTIFMWIVGHEHSPHAKPSPSKQ